MKYLGVLRGNGTLSMADAVLGAAAYDIEGYQLQQGEVVGAGELRMTPQELANAFGRRGLRLTTDDGRVLSVRFSARKLPSDSDTAHAEFGGDLPVATAWSR